ncbi:putative Formylglycine-generating enzyme, required for sulfatase activity, contains SUMF1/FGE domain [Gammaproteobacteria bacterium]
MLEATDGMDRNEKLTSRHGIGRADLLKCLVSRGEKSLAKVAPLLGFQIERGFVQPLRNRPQSEPVGPALAPISAPVSLPSPPEKQTQGNSPAAFAYLKDRQSFAPEEGVGEEPEWVRHPVPLKPEPRQRPAPPTALPLTRWARLWPFLKAALGAERTIGEVDLTRIIADLAEGRPLMRLPRQRRHGWAPQAQLLLDIAPGLFPYWDDFHRLHRDLIRLRGRAGLEVVVLRDGPEGTYSRDGASHAPVVYRPPPPGTPLLILSDLGALTGDHRVQAWQRLGRRLVESSVEPVALLPCGERYWPAATGRWFHQECWDWEVRLPQHLRQTIRRLPPPADPDDERDITKLLALAAPVVRLEPALLRALRHLLLVDDPALEVGSEARLWSHPDVTATNIAAAIRPDRIGHYHAWFRIQPLALRRQAATLIREHHRYLPEAIRAEEELVLARLEAGEDEGGEAFFQRAVTALLGKTDYHCPQELATWGHRVVGRQTNSAYRESEAMATLWAALHREVLKRGEPLDIPTDFPLEQVAWVWGKGGVPRTFTLMQRGQGLVLTEKGKYGDWSEGSPVVDLILASPWLRYRIGDGSEQIIAVVEGRALPLPEEGLILRTDRAKLTIATLSRPSWAVVLGRDGRGLYAILADGRRINWPEWPEWADTVGWDEYGVWADFSFSGVTQRMRWIEAGQFMMGSPKNEPERENDETQHKVILTQGYWLADTACTQALWQVVMKENPSRFKGEERPVELVSWEDVQRFIVRLNDLKPALALRLPTEDEWEYACRAGTSTPFWFGENITPEQVNYNGNYPYNNGKKGRYRKRTVEVKALPCNGWGFYQMHGNVWEWCNDKHSAVRAGRVLRGGSWIGFGWYVRSAYRSRNVPGDRNGIIGFRLALGRILSDGSDKQ